MSPSARLAGLAGIAAMFASSAFAGNSATAVTVRSSLDGKTVLPYRIHWLGFPSVPQAKVTEVDFLVDSRLVWVERQAPYTYGFDRNWLVTSWLKPGIHRFTVRLVTKSGARATDTVKARTLPPPPPPAGLVGNWRRTVTQAQAGTDTPAGTWRLTIDQTGWKITDPLGGRSWIDVAYLGASHLQARGGIWTVPVEARGGNGWCEDSNAPVNYTWALSGTTLTLSLAGADRCGDPHNKQHFIWAGNWGRLP